VRFRCGVFLVAFLPNVVSAKLIVHPIYYDFAEQYIEIILVTSLPFCPVCEHAHTKMVSARSVAAPVVAPHRPTYTGCFFSSRSQVLSYSPGKPAFGASLPKKANAQDADAEPVGKSAAPAPAAQPPPTGGKENIAAKPWKAQAPKRALNLQEAKPTDFKVTDKGALMVFSPGACKLLRTLSRSSRS